MDNFVSIGWMEIVYLLKTLSHPCITTILSLIEVGSTVFWWKAAEFSETDKHIGLESSNERNKNIYTKITRLSATYKEKLLF